MEQTSISEILWVGFGLAAQAVFAARFVWQWIVSERRKESVVPVGFWYFSLVGGVMLSVYAIYRDPVLIPGQVAGVVIYLRNLALIHRSKSGRAAPANTQASPVPHAEPARPAQVLKPVPRVVYPCDLSLVCPAFNEADNLPKLLAEWQAALSSTGLPFEMIVVDDCSTDATPEVLRAAQQEYPVLRVLRQARRSGQSASLAAGFEAAHGQWIVTSDADLQNDPADLSRMLALTPRFDVVCGWRADRKDPWTKRLISRFANVRRRRALDDGVHDTGCGLKVLRRDAAERMIRFDGMHRFFPALAKIEGFSVTEVPVRHRPRKHGQSKYWLFNRFRKPIQDLRGVAWYRSRHLNYTAQEITARVSEAPPIARAG